MKEIVPSPTEKDVASAEVCELLNIPTLQRFQIISSNALLS